MKRTSKRNQRGMASIMITMITMMVISLIVLGFANVARRERGQSLDRQLSTQAFYAAESGIEDARKVIEAAVTNGVAVPGKTDCTQSAPLTAPNGQPLPTYPEGDRMVLQDNVSYSCMLVNPNPTSLQYNGVDADSTVIPVKASNGRVSRIEVKWSPSAKPEACARTDGNNGPGCAAGNTRCLDGNINTAGNGDRFMVPFNNWNCLYGLMRMDIVPTEPQAGIGLSRNRLLNGTVAGWFVPTQSNSASGSINFENRYNANMASNGNPQPNVIKADCETGPYGTCSAIINNLAPSNEYVLRLSSMYEPSNVTVTAQITGGAPANLTGAQAVVDVTGKAQDVLRRIVARIPVNASRGQVPGYAIQSNGSLCKRFEVTPGYFNIPGNFPSGAGNHDADNAMCTIRSDGTPSNNGNPSTPPVTPPVACTEAHDIGLVLDSSTSMVERSWGTYPTRLAKLKEVANRIVNHESVVPDRNQLAISQFNGNNTDRGRMLISLSTNRYDLRQKIERLVPEEGGTWYLTGMEAMEREMQYGGATRADAPNVYIIITDGHPWDDKDEIRALANKFKRDNATVFTIGIGSEQDDDGYSMDKQLLIDMASSRRHFADAQDTGELDAAMNAIFAELNCGR